MEPSTVQAVLLRQENRRLQDRIASLERENETLKRAAAARPHIGLAQLKEIADLIPAIIWANDEHGACVFANKECTAFTGRDSSEEAGEAWTHSIHPDDKEEAHRVFQTCLTERRRYSHTYRMYSQIAGGYRWILDTGAPVYLSEGRYAGLIGTCVDVTTQKELEQTLRQANARLEQETKSKLEFLSVMSHELRTPLTSIIGLSEILSSTLPTQEGMSSREHLLLAIRTAALHLKQLVSNFLDAEKFEKCGCVTLVNGRCNLLSGLRDVIAIMQPAAETKALSLRLECDIPFADCNAWVDETRWKQIAINLVSNAIKFTDKGSIVVSLKRTQDHSFLLTVADTGIGIAPEHRGKVVLPFSQVTPSAGHSQEGTGLGLYVTRKIIDAWGGTFNISENQPHGTVIQVGFTPLPIPLNLTNSDIDRAPSGDTDLPQFILNSKDYMIAHALIVDDNRTIQQILQHILRKLHLQTTDSAFDGAEGIAMLSQRQYDIVFMDCQMPVLDGFAAVRRIRSMNLAMQPIIIAVTALALPGDRERCIAAGMDDYLQKPFTQSNVQRCVESALQLLKQRLSTSLQPVP